MNKPLITKERQSSIATVALLIVAIWTLSGINSGLNALEDRVRVLDKSVQELNMVESQISTLQKDVREIGRLRNDILEAIAAASARSDKADRIGARADRDAARRDHSSP